MRTRRFAVLSAAAVASAMLLPGLAAGAPTGLTPPVVSIVVTCNAQGGHTFATTVSNPANGSPITLNPQATLTVNAGTPGPIGPEAATPIAPGASLALLTASPLGDPPDAGVVVFNGTYTRPNSDNINLVFTEQFDACEATPPPPPPPPPPVVEPTFTG